MDPHDGGRDGAFAGTWKQNGREDISGRFVIQCKFTSRSTHILRASDVTDELAKVKRLVARRLCDSYVLMTNAGLLGTRAEEIEALFTDAGVKRVLILGSTWINQQILENKRLRMLVPRVYGLGDLSQILDERAYSQARAILESLREDLAKVVVTDAYKKAAEALDKQSFVLLIGEPAAGGLTATVADMGRYMAFYLDGADPLAAEAVSLLAGEPDGLGRAYLWNTFRLESEGMLYHGGGTFGTSSWISLYPCEGIGVFLVTPYVSDEAQTRLNETANRIVEALRALAIRTARRKCLSMPRS